MNKKVEGPVEWGKVAIGCGMLLGKDIYEEEGYLFIKQEFCEELVKCILSHPDLYLRKKCPHCVWWQFEEESVGMTPCSHCNSTGYIYEEIKSEEGNCI